MKRILIGLIACLFAGTAMSQVAREVTLNMTQTTRSDGKVDVSLTWNTTPKAKGCVSSGSWTGSRSASRSNPLLIGAVTPPKDFTLTCTWDSPTGQATLYWQPPTQNADGTPLTNLKEYRIYYGSAADALSTTIAIDNPGVVTRVISPLASQTWFFAMTAINTANVESVRSATVSKTIAGLTASKTVTARAEVPKPPGNVFIE